MLQKTKFTLLILAIAFTLIVALQNTGPVDINILFTSLRLSKTVLIIVTLAIGFLVGAFITGRMLRHRHAKRTKHAPLANPAKPSSSS